jgi:LytS/YehU family sensor histidine kinase
MPALSGTLHLHFLKYFFTGLRLLERQSKIEKIQEEAEKAKLNAELTFLKNQICPHFFFNSLNIISSLIDRSTEDSKNAVI